VKKPAAELSRILRSAFAGCVYIREGREGTQPTICTNTIDTNDLKMLNHNTIANIEKGAALSSVLLGYIAYIVHDSGAQLTQS